MSYIATSDHELLREVFGSRCADSVDLTYGLRGARPRTRAATRRLHALQEIAIRLASQPAWRGAQVSTPQLVYEVLAPRLRGETREHFVLLPLDTRHRLLCEPIVVAVGHTTGVSVDPSQVLRPLIELAATRFVVAHNHPSSGSSEPSPQDLALTERLRQAGDLVGISLVDHVIIGDGAWVSLHERGFL